MINNYNLLFNFVNQNYLFFDYSYKQNFIYFIHISYMNY